MIIIKELAETWSHIRIDAGHVTKRGMNVYYSGDYCDGHWPAAIAVTSTTRAA